MKNKLITRRELIKNSLSVGLLSVLPFSSLVKANSNHSNLSNSILYKTIPTSGEKIPAIGMGTWITFNVGDNLKARNERTKVLETFFQMGGEMIDSSPMYGSSEQVVGYALNRLNSNPNRSNLFSATKIWTVFSASGKNQIENSQQLWGLKQFDLLQVHNLLAWEAHLELLKEQRENGSVRYIGVTTSHGRRHRDMEKIIQTEPIDFVQLTYNVLDRAAENRLLPAAREKGVAVIANRPFQRKQLFNRFANQPLPSWASEIDCQNWAEFFLKFVISHPAITCAIPATSQVPHMLENMNAMKGLMPDQKTRTRMLGYLQTL